MLKYAIYYISECIYFKADFYQSNVSTLVVNPFYSDVCFNAFVLGLVYLLWYLTPTLQLNFYVMKMQWHGWTYLCIKFNHWFISTKIKYLSKKENVQKR